MRTELTRRAIDAWLDDHLEQERLIRLFRNKRRRKGRDGRVLLPQAGIGLRATRRSPVV